MFTFKVVIIFTACLTWSFCAENKYCSLCKDHTMCKYTGVGPECQKSGYSGVSESEKKEILDVHNWLRRTVATGKEKRGVSGGQPKAADMMKFVWDDELAKVAQRWADQCQFGHDSCRNDPRWYVGQNVHWKSQTRIKPVNWTDNILSWYKEVEKFNPKDIDKYRFDGETGHYTQLLWHDTYVIGCGRRDYGQEQLSVCNYGPGGNVINSKMYTKGEPCSSCPKGTTCEDSLCAATTLYPRSEIPPDHETNAYWRSNVIPEEVKSTEEKSFESNPAKDSSFREEKTEISQGQVTTGEDDNDNEIDEETKDEIRKILVQVENLLKTFIKKSRKERLIDTQPCEHIPLLSDYMQFHQLFNGQ